MLARQLRIKTSGRRVGDFGQEALSAGVRLIDSGNRPAGESILIRGSLELSFTLVKTMANSQFLLDTAKTSLVAHHFL